MPLCKWLSWKFSEGISENLFSELNKTSLLATELNAWKWICSDSVPDLGKKQCKVTTSYGYYYNIGSCNAITDLLLLLTPYFTLLLGEILCACASEGRKRESSWFEDCQLNSVMKIHTYRTRHAGWWQLGGKPGFLKYPLWPFMLYMQPVKCPARSCLEKIKLQARLHLWSCSTSVLLKLTHSRYLLARTLC